MKYLVLFLSLIVCASQATAFWSGFAFVTPEYEHNYELNFTMEPSENSPGEVTIKFAAEGIGTGGRRGKQVWLIVASKPLSYSEQELRSFIWNKSQSRDYVVSMMKISPRISGNDHLSQNIYYQLNIDITDINKKYLYIDFPNITWDGGYYYSIDLGTYYQRMKDRATSTETR